MIKHFFIEKLATALPNYRHRDAQIAMAEAVNRCIEQHDILLAEAGTGTGKTWAYLVPALLSGKKTIISTATLALQDQLFNKDLPCLLQHIDRPVQVALLKGRNNYLCRQHFQVLDASFRKGSIQSFANQHHLSVEQAKLWPQIQQFAHNSDSGEHADLTTVQSHPTLWAKVVSSHQTCLQKQCDYWHDCFVNKARDKAKNADIVIINHALFYTHLRFASQGLELLPEADILIFDEAHQLPAMGNRFLGDQFSLDQLFDMLDQTIQTMQTNESKNNEHLVALLRSYPWQQAYERMHGHFRRLLQMIKQHTAGEKNDTETKCNIQDFDDKDDFLHQLSLLTQELSKWSSALNQLSEASFEIKQCYDTTAQELERLLEWQQRRDPLETVRWFSLRGEQLLLIHAPLSLHHVGQKKSAQQAWVLTSATLSSAHQDFSYYQQIMGLQNAKTGHWPSPFDYANKGLLYLPPNLPDVNTSHHYRAFIDSLMAFLPYTRGGTLILSTSTQGVQRMASYLKTQLAKEEIDRQVFCQGEKSLSQLLNDFQQVDNGILIGTNSLWEGIDLPGEYLTTLAIEKLPFIPPDDPLFRAQEANMRANQQNPFTHLQLPTATIRLKQGIGRLIRTEEDFGVVMLGDNRIETKPSYGPRLLDSLPPFYRSKSLQDVLAFWGVATTHP